MRCARNAHAGARVGARDGRAVQLRVVRRDHVLRLVRGPARVPVLLMGVSAEHVHDPRGDHADPLDSARRGDRRQLAPPIPQADAHG